MACLVSAVAPTAPGLNLSRSPFPCCHNNNSLHCVPRASLTRLIIARVQNHDEADGPRRAGEGAQSLWRKELQQQQQAGVDFSEASPSWSDESFLNRSVEQDMQVLSQKREAEKQFSRNGAGGDEKPNGNGFLGSAIEKLLVADFFFLLFILAWFIAGLVEKAAFDTSSLLDAWLPLWPKLFQPAVGFFMAGALWTAVSKSWFKR